MLLSKRLFQFFAILAACEVFLGTLSASPAQQAMPWAKDLATAQDEAARSGKLILIHFSGDRCAPCVRVERNVFSQAVVGHQIGTAFVPVHINASAQPKIARQFQVTSWPTDLVLTSAGQELHRMTSPQDPRAYLAELGKSVWRAQNMGQAATAVANQTQTPQRQTIQRTVAQQSVPQQSVPQQSVPQQSVPQQTVPQMHVAQAYGIGQQHFQSLAQTNHADAQATAAPHPAQPTIPALQFPPTTPTNGSLPVVQTDFASLSPPAASLSPPAASLAPPAALTITPSPKHTLAPAAPSTPDLYPAAQNSSTAHQQQAYAAHPSTNQTTHIPTIVSPPVVQPTAYSQPPAGTHLPPGQDPFNVPAVPSTSTSAVMLNNPFITNVAPPTQSVPPQVATAPAPQSHPLPSATPQPVATPQPAAPNPASFAATPQDHAMPNLAPTPALTLATSPEPPKSEPSASVPQPPTATVPAPTAPAMEGFCCVTLHHEDRWVKGDARWGAQHRGKVFLFHSEEAQQRFLNDPDKYSPLLSGYDPVVFQETGELKTGSRAHGVRYQDMTCLFSSEASLQRFWESPWQFAQNAKQAMRVGTTVR